MASQLLLLKLQLKLPIISTLSDFSFMDHFKNNSDTFINMSTYYAEEGNGLFLALTSQVVFWKVICID